MTAAVEVFASNGLFQGRAAHIRFWGYIGLMAGAALFAFFGGNGYDEDNYLFRLFTMQGLVWCGAGAIAGGIFGGYLTSLMAPVIGSEKLLFVSAVLLWLEFPQKTVSI